MQITVTDAKGQLLDLVRKAESGEDIVLTRHGHAVARIVAVPPHAAERRAALQAARGAAQASPGTNAANSQNFLYDDSGLPS